MRGETKCGDMWMLPHRKDEYLRVFAEEESMLRTGDAGKTSSRQRYAQRGSEGEGGGG